VKILLCEDDPLVQRLIDLSLRGSGHVVLLCGDGAEGLRLAEQERPDLVLTDVMMPGLSGLQLAAAIRDRPELARTRVLFMTAVDLPALPEWARNDPQAVLTKPFAPAELRARIEALAAAPNDG
jgi:CheY-like chemotaxis protein